LKLLQVVLKGAWNSDCLVEHSDAYVRVLQQALCVCVRARPSMHYALAKRACGTVYRQVQHVYRQQYTYLWYLEQTDWQIRRLADIDLFASFQPQQICPRTLYTCWHPLSASIHPQRTYPHTPFICCCHALSQTQSPFPMTCPNLAA
jgi:hypothetical protein